MQKPALCPKLQLKLDPQISKAGVVRMVNVMNIKHTFFVDKERNPAQDNVR